MRNLNLSRRAVSFTVVCLLLAGCGGSQTSLPTGARLAQTSAAQPNGKDLVYVASTSSFICFPYLCATGEVGVYTFPEGNFVKSWVGPKNSSVADGECADAAGEIFVTYSQKSGSDWTGEVLKFAHGGTKPVGTLSNESAFPTACSVDPVSGDLAVVSNSSNGRTGILSVYSDGSGSPTDYSYTGIYFYGVSYDDKGNIFVDGTYGSSVTFAELPKGGHSFKSIKLQLKYPGVLQWDGAHVTMGFFQSAPRRPWGHPMIYQLELRGNAGRIVGVTHLKSTYRDDVPQYWVAGKQIVAVWFEEPAGCPVSGCGPQLGTVGLWDYPTGQVISKRMTSKRPRFYGPTGVALSLAQRQ